MGPGGPVRTFWRRRPHRIYRLAPRWPGPALRLAPRWPGPALRLAPQLPGLRPGALGAGLLGIGLGIGVAPTRGVPGSPDLVTERPLVAATCNEMGVRAPIWLLVAHPGGRCVTKSGWRRRVRWLKSGPGWAGPQFPAHLALKARRATGQTACAPVRPAGASARVDGRGRPAPRTPRAARPLGGRDLNHSQRNVFGALRMRMSFAGTPPTTAFSGTSQGTTAFVPITELLPTVTPRRMQAP